MRHASGTPSKKPYIPPKLTVYGDLTQITLTRAMKGGNFDNKKLVKRT